MSEKQVVTLISVSEWEQLTCSVSILLSSSLGSGKLSWFSA